MNESRWLKVMTVGLILAALAVGYFMIAGKFAKPSPKDSTVLKTVEPSPLASASPVSAYTRIVERNLINVETLPKTASPVSLLMVFSAGAIVAGMGLRKFPN